MRLFLLYNVLLVAGAGLALPLMLPLVLLSRKRRKTVLRRLGLATVWDVPAAGTLSAGGSLWIHALSVGEVLSALPLVTALSRVAGERRMVFSASTLTGFTIARQRLKGRLRHVCYYPYDFLFSVRRITRAVDPALVILVESDIWPNFLLEMKRRAVPVVLVNARLSDRSFRGYRRLGTVLAPMFHSLAGVCAQTAADARRFARLGIHPERITVTGNIKYDADSGHVPASAVPCVRALRSVIRDRPVLVAGSTHRGEEPLIGNALTRIRRTIPELFLVVAPRNPDRAGAVIRRFQSDGWTVAALGSLLPDGKPAPDVVVVDTMGVLKWIYELADVAFVGGSLVTEGGHNPLEPAQFARPVIFGPDMRDFADIARDLQAADGARRVNTAGDMADTVVTLMMDNRLRTQMGNRAAGVFRANSGAVQRTVAAVQKAMRP